jgi:hypothetical protein
MKHYKKYFLKKKSIELKLLIIFHKNKLNIHFSFDRLDLIPYLKFHSNFFFAYFLKTKKLRNFYSKKGLFKEFYSLSNNVKIKIFLKLRIYH